MILILGGTTEGRHAVRVCDDANKPYYYSTKSVTQEVVCAHGIRLTGGMNVVEMIDLCLTKDIKLIVDAAHPFAEGLHQTVAEASAQLKIPVVRYERSYPEHDETIVWFNDYDEAIDYLFAHKVTNLLALTGVNTIAKLGRYWREYPSWFRILDRDESREVVKQNNFPFDKTIYYKQGEDDIPLFAKLKPDAIITKESGDSGGFNEKILAAKVLNIPILVVKRPTLSSRFLPVYGENGLRKMIERLLPNFFDLRTGYTTGTCATAASKAALTALLTQACVDEVSLTLPSGEWIKIPIFSTTFTTEEANCTVIKDAGDDPDVTNKKEIVSTIRLSDIQGVHFLQGIGVGRVTLPGLDIEIGEPAINKTPRMMIKRELFKVLRHQQDRLPNQSLKVGVDVTISVPEGEEMAKRTFNPKLGIVGGISIIGTSGIVKPFSSEAFVASIRKELSVAKALGCEHIVINSGAKSEKYVKAIYPDFASQAFVHYGNFIGETIELAAELDFKKLTIGIMLGKAVKLAEGHLDTHSKKTVMNKDFLIEVAKQLGCGSSVLTEIENLNLARQLWTIIPKENYEYFSIILGKCQAVCTPLLPGGEITVLLITEEGEIISK